ncbi:MAG: hypothetical protein GY710_24155 [Desulfobacteraceae bacterium]|nr:hypothetical protein [Desulfobacteraceae bacterium]
MKLNDGLSESIPDSVRKTSQNLIIIPKVTAIIQSQDWLSAAEWWKVPVNSSSDRDLMWGMRRSETPDDLSEPITTFPN